MTSDAASALPSIVDPTGVAAVPGTANFRTIGPPAHVRPGALWRADGLADLGEDGRDALRTLGVRTVVDLRQDVERDQHPDDLDGVGADLRAVPILGDDLDVATITGLDDLYDRILSRRGDRLTDAVRALAAPGAFPAVVHCSAGKDRTGLVAALVLSVAGVPADVIAEDYARTAELLRGEALERVHARALEAGLGAQQLAAALTSPADAMTRALRTVADEHGGAEAYLRRHGLTDDELARLRDALALPA